MALHLETDGEGRVTERLVLVVLDVRAGVKPASLRGLRQGLEHLWHWLLRVPTGSPLWLACLRGTKDGAFDARPVGPLGDLPEEVLTNVAEPAGDDLLAAAQGVVDRWGPTRLRPVWTVILQLADDGIVAERSFVHRTGPYLARGLPAPIPVERIRELPTRWRRLLLESERKTGTHPAIEMPRPSLPPSTWGGARSGPSEAYDTGPHRKLSRDTTDWSEEQPGLDPPADGPVSTDLLPEEVELPGDEDLDRSVDQDEVATDPAIPALTLPE